jgi:N-acetylglucosaminyl-diphospho-decaprenol L-rhamnosyltransferase
MHDQPDVTVIVVNYNTAHRLEEMFSALNAAWGTLRHQVIVVDNASRDDSVQMLRTRYPSAELIENKVNVGFARANNQAVPLGRGRYILLLNTDAFVAPDSLRKTVDFMDAHAECGVLGVKIVGDDGSLQPSCRFFPTPWNGFLVTTGLYKLFPRARLVDDMAWDHASIRECDWVPGCFYLVRREVIDRLGLFDPRFFLYFEEVDHCRAVKQTGWKVLYYPFTQIVHIGGESALSEGPLALRGGQISALQIESELLYFRKHYGLAGLFIDLLLGVIADIVVAGKALLRANKEAIIAAAQHAWTMLKLSLWTRLGSRATR